MNEKGKKPCPECTNKFKEYQKLIKWANDMLWKAVERGIHENELYESGEKWIDHPLVKEVESKI